MSPPEAMSRLRVCLATKGHECLANEGHELRVSGSDTVGGCDDVCRCPWSWLLSEAMLISMGLGELAYTTLAHTIMIEWAQVVAWVPLFFRRTLPAPHHQSQGSTSGGLGARELAETFTSHCMALLS